MDTSTARAAVLAVGAGAGAAAAARSHEAMAAGAAPGGGEPHRRVGEPGYVDPPGYGLDGDGDSHDEPRWERTDEMPVREKRHRGAGLLLGALALLAVAGVAWVLWQVVGPGTRPPEPGPDFTNR